MPPKSYKKLLKSVHKKPKWVDADVDSPEPGLVYNIYECQECIISNEEDKERPKFKRMVKVPWRKSKSLEQVCPEHRSLLLVKYKICKCGKESWGTKLKSARTCQYCGPYSDYDYEGAPVTYYRMGDYFKVSEKDLGDANRSDCRHRSKCLEVTFKGSKKGIACKDCPYYKEYTI